MNNHPELIVLYTVWLSGTVCFDGIAIEFGNHFKPLEKGVKFRVNMPHAFFSAN